MDRTTTSTSGTTTGRRTVVGVFDGPNHAEQALNELKNSGFSPEQVSVVAKDNRETRGMVEHTGMGAEGGAAERRRQRARGDDRADARDRQRADADQPSQDPAGDPADGKIIE